MQHLLGKKNGLIVILNSKTQSLIKVAMIYKQLTQEQRYQIDAYSKAGWLQKDIATVLKCDRTTLYREKRRNKGKRGYRPVQAHKKAQERKKSAKKHIKMTAYLKFEIAKKIRNRWSPEQIAGYFKRHKIANISHQTIYCFISKNKLSDPKLYKNLRHSKKKRKKKYGSTEARGQIKDRIMIDKRPKVVDDKSRIGDWEVDTVMGRNNKGAIVTMVERKSKFIVACPVLTKGAKEVTNAMIRALKPYQNRVLTLTGDNGKEFAWHKIIAQKLNAKFFFAHPYCSWERGLNENSNGLLRQYYPKKTDLRIIDPNSIHPVLEEINNRPRKTLGYATPKEVFFERINSESLQYQNVALAT